MNRIYWAAIVIVAVSILAGGWAAARYFRERQSETIHYNREETELIVTNLAGAPAKLFQAGKRLEEAVEVAEFNGSPIWLSPGNYFLKVDINNQPLFYPVTIRGYRLGPDKDGSFLVTVRRHASGSPPGNATTWAFIPSGNFLIGDRLNPREPHYLWLPAYFISAFEVTNAEFREFIRDPQGYADQVNWTEAGRKWKSENPSSATALLGESGIEFKRFGQDDQPVTWVSWFEAEAFCHWLTAKFGQGQWQFSLPAEAEWEKAARGPDGFDYGLSRMLSDEESKLYNWKKNPDAPVTVIGIEETRAKFLPNRFGLYHVSGNVVEWTQTINRPYNRERPYADDDRNRADSTDARVARGGSWYSASIALLGIAYRDTFQPEVRHHDLGFRIVARPLP